MKTQNSHTIGIFDSGLGGLTVARHIRDLLPKESIMYLAGQVHAPYGERSQQEIFDLTKESIPTLITEGAKVVVIACNSASVAVIEMLRETYPETPFVAVVPMIKPAAKHTKSGTVAVFATNTTLQSALYQDLKQKHAKDITVIDVACPEWVEIVESGKLDEGVVRKPVQDTLRAGADQLVLGCTHFPFLTGLLEQVVENRADLLESGPAVARQVHRILKANDSLVTEGSGTITCLTSGDSNRTTKVAQQLTGEKLTFDQVGR